MKTKTNDGKLTLKHRIGYGLGDASGVLTFTLMSTFFSRYCLNILGVSNELLATLLLIWNIWDAVNDPLMGALMDRIYAKHHNKNGKFRPWILRATPMLAVSAVALWTVPTFFEGAAMIVMLVVCKLLYEGFYTMFNIPMGSLLSAMANNDEERAQLSSARGIGGTIFGIIPALLFPIIIKIFGETAKGYGVGIVILAALGLVLGLMHYFFTEERNNNVAMITSDSEAKLNFKDIISLVTKNRAFLALCIHSIFICGIQAVSGTIGSYIYADVFDNIALMSMASLLILPFYLLVCAVAPKIAKKTGLVKMIRVSLLASVIAYAGLFAVMMTMNISVWVYLVWNTLASTLYSVALLMQYGLLAEAIDYNEYIGGKRAEGTMYGTFSLARRIGTTVGASLVVLFIGWTGYVKGAEVQTESVKAGLKVIAVLIPAIMVLGIYVAFRFIWNINDDMRKKISDFKESKAGNGADAEETEA